MKWNEVTWYSRLGALLLFLVVVPILAFIIGEKFEQIQEIQTTTIQTNLVNKIIYNASFTFATSTISTDAEDFSINTPIINIPKNKNLEQKINSGIQSMVSEVVANYEESALPCTTVAGKPCKTSVEVTSTTTLSGKFNSTSVEFDVFLSSEKLAHPDFERAKIAVFDLYTGNIRPYYEILGIDQNDLLNKLAYLSKSKLEDKFGNSLDNQDDVFLHGTEPKQENYNFVSLDQDGLIVRFSYYQIGARPFGAPEVFISYKELGL